MTNGASPLTQINTARPFYLATRLAKTFFLFRQWHRLTSSLLCRPDRRARRPFRRGFRLYRAGDSARMGLHRPFRPDHIGETHQVIFMKLKVNPTGHPITVSRLHRQRVPPLSIRRRRPANQSLAGRWGVCLNSRTLTHSTITTSSSTTITSSTNSHQLFHRAIRSAPFPKHRPPFHPACLSIPFNRQPPGGRSKQPKTKIVSQAITLPLLPFALFCVGLVERAVATAALSYNIILSSYC